MTSVACLVLLALLGAMCSGNVVKRESPPEIRYRPCFINGNEYLHGEPTGDACGRCGCLDGKQVCGKAACIVDGEPVPLPTEANNGGRFTIPKW